MKTINTCSIFTSKIEKILISNKITNGIGGKGFNLDKYFKDNIEILDIFIPEKGKKLYKDIYRLHYLHDICYLVGGSKLQFYFANYIFARDLYKLLNFIGFFKRISILLTVFILLNRHGKKYFNFK